MKKLISLICLCLFISSCGQEAGGGEGTDGVAVADHRVFVTSNTYTGSGIGGVSGGDSICSLLAKNAGLERTYKAILSDDIENATRLIFSGGVYIVDSSGESQLIASTGSDLWDTDNKNLLGSINLDEYGNSVSSDIWTGTSTNGGTMIDHCSNWSSSSGSGARGHTDLDDDRWIENTGDSCSSSYPIFCISQGS